MQSRFATTSWTTVLAARGAPSSEARQALEALCRAYWYPLYVFVRRQGHDAEDARDLTQAYFAELLEKEYIDDYDPSRGRFRVFLMASVKHFLSKQRAKVGAWKRGGRACTLSLDTEEGDARYHLEPVERQTPETIFELRWALTVLERALGELRREQAEAGRADEFARLQGLLTGEQPKAPYRDLAVALSTSESAIKMTVHRLRHRFGELLRLEIQETVAGPEAVDDEVRHLLRIVAARQPPPD